MDDVAVVVGAEIDHADQIPGIIADDFSRASEKLGLVDLQHFMTVIIRRHLVPLFAFQYFVQQLQAVAAVAGFPLVIVAFVAFVLQ